MKKSIPKVSQPSRQARDIEGLSWAVSRLTARRSPSVLSRLVADVGEMVAEVLSSPDRELPPEIEAAIVRSAGKMLSPRVLKAILFSHSLGRVRDLDLGWYVEHVIVGLMSVNGVEIETMDELDETGIGPAGVLELIWYAIEVNFDFTGAGLATPAGSEEPAATNLVSGTSSYKGARNRDGRQAPTQASTG